MNTISIAALQTLFFGMAISRTIVQGQIVVSQAPTQQLLFNEQLPDC